jgi:hypothetical protein
VDAAASRSARDNKAPDAVLNKGPAAAACFILRPVCYFSILGLAGCGKPASFVINRLYEAIEMRL